MYFIKTCPKCKKSIRFPIDKGKIKVKCGCGYSFLADPDNSELYKKGKFDLSFSDKRSSKKKGSLNFAGFDREQIIKKTLDIKYKLQNFKLLPYNEQKAILLRLTIFLTFIAIIVIIISYLIIN